MASKAVSIVLSVGIHKYKLELTKPSSTDQEHPQHCSQFSWYTHALYPHFISTSLNTGTRAMPLTFHNHPNQGPLALHAKIQSGSRYNGNTAKEEITASQHREQITACKEQNKHAVLP